MTDLELDPILAQWLRDGPEHGREHGLERALAATRRVDQRPAWTFPRRWLPAHAAGAQMGVSRLVVLGLALTVAALLAMAVVAAGTILRTSRPVGQGDMIAYQEGAAIYVARPDGSDRLDLSGAVPFARLPVFSPDGQRVAFVAPSSAGALDGRLMVAPIDGAGPAIEVSDSMELLASDVPQMSWSPDGERIAFSGLEHGVATIFVTASDGGRAPVAITDGTADRDVPTWSPDGDWIGFREKDGDGIRTSLRRTSPDGTDVQEITLVIAPDASLSKPRWISGANPMSYWFNAGLGSEASAYIDLGAGHKNEPWTGEPGGWPDFGLPWSPDGQRLAILTRDEGVIIADYDATEPYDGHLRRLGRVAACWVDWAPDGTALYGGSPDGCNGVVVIPLSDPGAATTVPGSTSGVASWQPSP